MRAATRVARRWANRLAKNPRSIDDWQIFSEPGAGVAAKALSAALKKSQTVLLRTLKGPGYKHLEPDHDDGQETKVAKLIGQIFDKHMYPVMLKFDDFGAADSEPRYVGAQGLINVAKKFYGMTGWTSLGDHL